MQRLPITLCMMVRNEASCIARCLASLAHIVAEIVVVDTGSTDDTVDILRRYGACVVTAAWQNDFAESRNLGLVQATQPWILVLDADEELMAPNLDYMRSLLTDSEVCDSDAYNLDVCGYFVKIRNLMKDGANSPYITDSACRLFRNHPQIRFKGAIHESVIADIQALGGRIEFSEIALVHHGYTPEIVAAKDKNTRNLHILEYVLAKNPADPFLQYALATEYFQQARYEDAVQILYPLLAKVPISVGYVSDIVLKTAYALRSLGRLDAALNVLAAGRRQFADFPDLLDLEASLLIQQGDFMQAKQLLAVSIQLGDMSYKYTSMAGSGTYYSRLLIGITEESLGDFAKAIEQYQTGIALAPNYLPLWQQFAHLTLGIRRADVLRGHVRAYADELSDPVWQLICRALGTHLGSSRMENIVHKYPTHLCDPFLDVVLCSVLNLPAEVGGNRNYVGQALEHLQHCRGGGVIERPIEHLVGRVQLRTRDLCIYLLANV